MADPTRYKVLLTFPAEWEEPIKAAAATRNVPVTRLINELVRVYCKLPKAGGIVRGRPKVKISKAEALALAVKAAEPGRAILMNDTPAGKAGE